jgi:hypothetical protein
VNTLYMLPRERLLLNRGHRNPGLHGAKDISGLRRGDQVKQPPSHSRSSRQNASRALIEGAYPIDPRAAKCLWRTCPPLRRLSTKLYQLPTIANRARVRRRSSEGEAMSGPRSLGRSGA